VHVVVGFDVFLLLYRLNGLVQRFDDGGDGGSGTMQPIPDLSETSDWLDPHRSKTRREERCEKSGVEQR
jgi:hypothetical protein